MKKTENSRIILWAILAIGIATVAIASYLIPTDSYAKAKIYTEPLGNFSFAVPQTIDLTRETIGDDQAFVKLTAPSDTSASNPGLGSLTVFHEVDGQTFAEQASGYLSVDENQLVPFASSKESLAYVDQKGQEVSYYYFFRNQGYILVFKFNKSYFDKANPMMLVDNSAYGNTFLRALKSIKYY